MMSDHSFSALRPLMYVFLLAIHLVVLLCQSGRRGAVFCVYSPGLLLAGAYVVVCCSGLSD